MTDFELVQVHIVARHGDRSPSNLYIGSPVFYDCGLVEGRDDARWTRLNDFHRQSLHQEGRGKTHFVRFPIFPGGSSKQCGLGQLTRTGFYQHRALGLQLWKRYAAALFQNFTKRLIADSMYVQSTDMSRTIQSAAAFLLGFLPDQQSLRRMVIIHVSPGMRLEAPPPSITRVFEPCKYFSSFHKARLKETDYYNIERMKYHPLLERLSHMFHLDISNQPIVGKVFDSIRTRGCHSKDSPLPCYHDHCIDYDFANKLFDFSDWAFTNAYTQNSSLVGLLPFLRHSVLALMEEVLQRREGAKKFVLSLGHDDVMTELLVALGIHIDYKMPYASRITFELWRAKDATLSDESAYHVRVLFNGKPVTHRLTAWKAIVADSLYSEFLGYSAWESYLVSGLYRHTQSYNKACGNL